MVGRLEQVRSVTICQPRTSECSMLTYAWNTSWVTCKTTQWSTMVNISFLNWSNWLLDLQRVIRTSLSLSIRNTLTVLSKDPDASSLPSQLHPTECTLAVWFPLNSFVLLWLWKCFCISSVLIIMSTALITLYCFITYCSIHVFYSNLAYTLVCLCRVYMRVLCTNNMHSFYQLVHMSVQL